MSAESGLVVESSSEATTARFREDTIQDPYLIQQISRELDQLLENDTRNVILDFSNVQFMSSSALGILVTFRKKVESLKGQVVICGMKQELRRIFKITNLERLFVFKEDKKSAQEAFNVTATS